MSDSIRKTLDLAPVIDNNLPVIIETNESTDSEKLKDDIDYARDTMYHIMEKGKDALEELYDVAKQSQHPRAYEAFNNMLKKISN